MPTRELLWTITEERRRQAAATARERMARPWVNRGSSAAGRLVGWLRDRLRARRDALAGSNGWSLAR